ncbi:MAG: ArnT family glycosyltransferase [Terriglobia bacterium]
MADNATPMPVAEPHRDRWLYAILLLALALRTYHLGYPPWDYHNWRQTNTLMVARDFARRGFDALHPQVAWVSGDQPSKPSYFCGEFSIESIFAALLYRAFGESHAAGRSVVIAFSLAGIYFLYLLLRRRAGVAAARSGALLLAVNPYWLFFGRVLTPEVPALALALGALNVLDQWTEEHRKTSLLLAAVLTSLAFLQTLSVLVVAAPALLLFWNEFGWRSIRRWEIYAYGAIAGVPAALWYWHSAALARASGFNFMPAGDLGRNMARWLEPPFLREVGSRLAVEAFSPIGLVMVTLALFGLARGRVGWLFRAWLLAGAGFLFLIPETLAQNYYDLLLLVPAGSALAGIAVARWLESPKLRMVALALLVLLAADAVRCARPLYREDRSPYDLGILLKNLTRPSDLIVTESGGSPNVLYAADRRGWIDPENNLTRLEHLAAVGARYYAPAASAGSDSRRDFFAALDERFYRLTNPDSPWPIFALHEPREVLEEAPTREIQNPYPVIFDNQIELLGISQRPLLNWPAAFEITYYWQCLKEVERNLRVFVHVTTAEGQMVASQDHWLLAGHFDVKRWKEGEVVRERYVVVLPAGLTGGRYQLRVGWFDPEKGDRLPIISPGASDGENRARVTEIEVRRPPRYGWFSVEE